MKVFDELFSIAERGVPPLPENPGPGKFLQVAEKKIPPEVTYEYACQNDRSAPPYAC